LNFVVNYIFLGFPSFIEEQNSVYSKKVIKNFTITLKGSRQHNIEVYFLQNMINFISVKLLCFRGDDTTHRLTWQCKDPA